MSPGRLLNVLRPFNLRPVSREYIADHFRVAQLLLYSFSYHINNCQYHDTKLSSYFLISRVNRTYDNQMVFST